MCVDELEGFDVGDGVCVGCEVQVGVVVVDVVIGYVYFDFVDCVGDGYYVVEVDFCGEFDWDVVEFVYGFCDVGEFCVFEYGVD